MLKYIDVIPSKETVARGESLNLLGGVANDGPACAADIAVWGNAGDGWRAVVTRRLDIAAGEHRHLYFTLTPELFAPDRWGGEAPEELELIISHEKPRDGARGKLVFID